MKDKYQVIAPRAAIAIYYGWEYGISRALDLLKTLGEVESGFFKVKPLFNDTYKTKRGTTILFNRVNDIVIAHRARMSKKLNISSSIYIIKVFGKDADIYNTTAT